MEFGIEKEIYMVTKTLYTCQFCNTDYADKEKAMECEKNHKILKQQQL